MEKMPVQSWRWPFGSRKAATLPSIVCTHSTYPQNPVEEDVAGPRRIERHRNIPCIFAESAGQFGRQPEGILKDPPHADSIPCCSCRSCGSLNHQPQKIVSQVAALRKHDPTIALIPRQSVTASCVGEIRGWRMATCSRAFCATFLSSMPLSVRVLRDNHMQT